MGRSLSAVASLALLGCASEVSVLELPQRGPLSVCHDDAWLDGVACNGVVEVQDDAELAAGLAGAAPGDCIDVTEGSYAPFSIPAGVEVLGRGADCVTIAGTVTMAVGDGAMLRGVTISGGGIVAPTSGVGGTVAHVRIAASPGDGIELSDGTRMTVEHTLVEGAGRYGILGWSSELTLRKSIVRGGAGPGVWLGCNDGDQYACGCPTKSVVVIEDCEVADNATVGVYLDETEATIDGLVVRGTRLDARSYAYGQGMVIALCTEVSGRAVSIADNVYLGLHIGSAAVQLTDLEVTGNASGILVEDVDGSAPETAIERAVVSSNQGVGVQAGPEARVSIRDATIRDTRLALMPILIEGVGAGVADVGDGLLWCEGASVRLADLTMAANPRLSIVVQRAVGAGSRMERITLTEGDEVKGILVQGATEPPAIDLGDGVPPLQIVGDEPYPTPCAALPPMGI